MIKISFFNTPDLSDLIYRIEKKRAYHYAERQKQKEEIYKIKYGKPKQKKTFSKMTTIFLYVNLTVVEIFCMLIMWRTMDLSSLSTFITCIVGEILVHFISCEKSKKENTQGGIIHDTAMIELQNKLSSLNINSTTLNTDDTTIEEEDVVIEDTGEAVG